MTRDNNAEGETTVAVHAADLSGVGPAFHPTLLSFGVLREAGTGLARIGISLGLPIAIIADVHYPRRPLCG